jgi:hypothetical protein
MFFVSILLNFILNTSSALSTYNPYHSPGKKKKKKAHTYTSNNSGGRGQKSHRVTVGGQTRQKVHKTPCQQNKLDKVVVYT